MVTQMIAVGEDCRLARDHARQDRATSTTQEVEATTEQLTSLIEPLMIAFLGVVIGGMIVALYMPIFQIATARQVDSPQAGGMSIVASPELG